MIKKTSLIIIIIKRVTHIPCKSTKDTREEGICEGIAKNAPLSQILAPSITTVAVLESIPSFKAMGHSVTTRNPQLVVLLVLA